MLVGVSAMLQGHVELIRPRSQSLGLHLSSHLRESLQGCEQESGHARCCGMDRRERRLIPTQWQHSTAVTAKGTLAGQKKKHCLHSKVPCFILHTRETMHLDHFRWPFVASSGWKGQMPLCENMELSCAWSQRGERLGLLPVLGLLPPALGWSPAAGGHSWGSLTHPSPPRRGRSQGSGTAPSMGRVQGSHGSGGTSLGNWVLGCLLLPLLQPQNKTKLITY